MNYGFVRIATAIPGVKVGDCKYNAQQIESLIIQAEGKGVEIICFPELSITAYTCGDLFAQQLLLDEAEMCLISILDFTRSLRHHLYHRTACRLPRYAAELCGSDTKREDFRAYPQNLSAQL